MPEGISRFLSEQDLVRISQAVKEAERKTSGEIVPYVVEQSDAYEAAVWRAGAMAFAFVLAIFGLIRSVSDVWPQVGLTGVILASFLLSTTMMVLVWTIPSFRRVFVGEELEERRVAQRASEAFLTEEVFNTKDRTGILIFVSLLEHKVIVMGDSGISSRVTNAEWGEVTRSVVDGMKAGKPAEGLIDAIRKSGSLLERKGITPRANDRDELEDRLRTEEDRE